jgi:hypothetical protein
VHSSCSASRDRLLPRQLRKTAAPLPQITPPSSRPHRPRTSLFCPPRARRDSFPSAREHAAILSIRGRHPPCQIRRTRARRDSFPSAREHAAIPFHPRPPSAAPNPPHASTPRFLSIRARARRDSFPPAAAIHRAKAAATPQRPQRTQPRPLAQLLFPRMEGGGWRWCAPSIPATRTFHPRGVLLPSPRTPADLQNSMARGWEEVRGWKGRSPTHLVRDPRSPSIDAAALISATSAHLQEQPVRLAPRRALTTLLSCCSNHCSPQLSLLLQIQPRLPTSAPSKGNCLIIWISLYGFACSYGLANCSVL